MNKNNNNNNKDKFIKHKNNCRKNPPQRAGKNNKSGPDKIYTK